MSGRASTRPRMATRMCCTGLSPTDARIFSLSSTRTALKRTALARTSDCSSGAHQLPGWVVALLLAMSAGAMANPGASPPAATCEPTVASRGRSASLESLYMYI
jgi:hypothetical protein